MQKQYRFLRLAAFLVLAALWTLPRPCAAQGPKVLSEGIQDLAKQVAASVSEEQKRKVAVLPFRAMSGKDTVLGCFLAEELVTRLFDEGSLQIVERTMLDQLLGEIDLAATGLIDPETAQEVGQVAGVDAIVTGSFTDLQSFVAVNARLIDTETGLVFAAAQVKIVRDDDVKKIMAMAMPGGCSGGNGRQGNEPSGKEPVVSGMQTQEAQGFRLNLIGCQASGPGLICSFVITSLKNDQNIQISGNSRLFDDFGNEYRVRRIQIANNSSSGTLSKDLIARVPTKASLEFQGISEEATAVAALELVFSGGTWSSLKFRNITISR